MAFILNASLNGNFRGNMSKAQQEFVDLAKQIQSLQKVQGDISSYQKYEKSAESTRTKLENLQRQHDLLQKEIKETSGDTTALERQDLQMEQRIRELTASLESQNQKLNDTGQRLRDAGVDTNNLTAESQRLTQEIRDLRSRQDEAADSAKNFGQSAADAFTAAGDAFVASGLIDGLKAAGEAYMGMVSMAANFEETMSTVEALSGSSGSEMQDLSALAKELGATTKFTANEAAEAMTYMAMAGWDAEQMMSGMDGVLQLAAASGEDLALTSDIVTDNLTAFGMTAAETARFSDVLAAAATNSNTSVSIMGETFKNSASVAGALGYSIEDVATAVGLMANSGIKGSIAGTALRNVFNGLLGGVTLTGAAFGEYEYSAVKADGTMKSFAETILDLRQYFDQMTEAEKVNNAITVAGQRGYNGLLAIVNSTEEDFAKLTEAINNSSGAAQKMASIKLDNLNGQITLLGSAWDAVQTTLGEEFNPELTNLAKYATDAVTALNGFLQNNPALVKGVIAGATALGGMATAVVAVSTAVKAFKALQAAGAFSALAGPIGIVVAGLGLMAGAYVGVTTAAKESLDATWELTSVDRQRKKELDELTKEYEEACEVYGEASQQALSLRYKVDDLNEEYENGKQTLDNYVAAHDELIQSYRDMSDGHRDAQESIEDEGLGVLALIEKLQDLTATTDDAKDNQETILAVINRLNKAVPELGLSYEKVIPGSEAFINSLREQAKAAAQAKLLEEEYAEWGDRIVRQQQLEAAQTEAINNKTLAQQEYDEAYEAYSNAVAKSKQWDYTGLGTLLTTMDEKAALEVAEKNLKAYTTAEEEATAAVTENGDRIKELEDLFGDYAAEQRDDGAVVVETINNITSQMAELQNIYEETYDAALESLQGQYAIWDKAAEVITTSVTDINAALQSQADYWTNYNANLESLAERAEDIDGLREVIASFADGSAESVNAIAGMATASDEDLKLMVENWKAVQDAQSGTATGLADFKTDYEKQMEELTGALKEDISELDLTEDAAASGRASIESFIAGANAMLPEVSAAYAKVKATAANALNGAIKPTTTPGSTTGYASGTTDAEPGWKWVGENGPELAYFNGGETVLTAKQSAEAVAGSTTFSPTITVQVAGNADASTVSDLRDYLNGDFIDQLKDLFADMQADQRRRVYS